MEKQEKIRVAIGSDHAGFELKEYLKEYLQEKNVDLLDFGCNSSESVDYPNFAIEVARSVSAGNSFRGILVCGSGSGMAISANKVKFIRAANCWSEEIVKLAREHNDINILCLGARFIDKELSKKIVDIFLETKFEGGRHLNRVEKIHQLSGI